MLRSSRTGQAEELDQLRLNLAQAKERINDLTRSQVELSNTIARLSELASTDVLTGLNNRRRFNEALDANFTLAARQQSALSVIMLDVDFFKSYNDTFGHSAGDEVLCVVAQQLLRSCRNYHVVARHGGEEFAILLPAATASQAVEYAEMQRAAIESYQWPLRRVTASFGVATLTPETAAAASLVEEADRALYHSKGRGRNRIIHHQDLTLEVAGGTPIEAGALPSAAIREVQATSDPDFTLRVLTATRAGETVDPAHPTTAMTVDFPKEGSIKEHSVHEPPTVAMDHFVRQLWDGRRAPDVRLTALSAIMDSVSASLVFVCSEDGNEPVDIVGDLVPTREWCHQFVQWLSTKLPNGGSWERPELKAARPTWQGRDPSAALLVPTGTSKLSWLVAVRFVEHRPFGPADRRLAQMIWRLQNEKRRYSHVHDNLKEALFGIVRCLSTAIDAKDPYTCGHSERVARIAVRLGKQMKLSSGEISDLYLAGLLHDVGKIGIRDDVLCKPGPLTPEEFAHIRDHSVIGERIIANVSRLSYLRPGVRGHHERFDGSGYPDGLVGEAIPEMARILAVSDACDAMMSARRYRRELSPVQIERIFEDGSGSQWDPRIVEAFFACRHDLYAVFQRGLGQSVYMAVERAAGAEGQDNRLRKSVNLKLPNLTFS